MSKTLAIARVLVILAVAAAWAVFIAWTLAACEQDDINVAKSVSEASPTPAALPDTAPNADDINVAEALAAGAQARDINVPSAAGTISIEHITYDKPYPNTLYKMTDTSTGVVCYYTLIGIPSCLQVLMLKPETKK
jgi:hypothetical protein